MSLCTDKWWIDKKLHGHTQSAINRREPGIAALVTKYNTLCDKIAHCITKGAAPEGSIPPVKIPKERVWSLDVDDEIWQDVGLEDGEMSGDAPDWLTDAKTRQGIQAMLDFERCVEEEMRLKRERDAMQHWLKEEWYAVLQALGDAGMFFKEGMVWSNNIE